MLSGGALSSIPHPYSAADKNSIRSIKSGVFTDLVSLENLEKRNPRSALYVTSSRARKRSQFQLCCVSRAGRVLWSYAVDVHVIMRAHRSAPTSTSTQGMSFNAIPFIPSGVFSGLTSLVSLRQCNAGSAWHFFQHLLDRVIDSNSIAFLEPGAFSDLRMLKVLSSCNA